MNREIGHGLYFYRYIKFTLWQKWWGILFFVLVSSSNNYIRVNSGFVAGDFVGNFITWDDMKVDYNHRHQQHHHHHYKYHLRHPHHHHHNDVMIEEEQRNLEFMGLDKNEGLQQSSRVIVVDQNGRGDSFTVQGAIDMVPNSNSQRVKIYILPGIYR